MDKKLKKEALKENLTYALKNGIEVSSYIDSYLFVFEYGVGPDEAERQIFINSLVLNEESIGSQALKFKTGETVRNSVGNWIKDYLSYADPNSLKGESYEMTQYMFSSPNVKALNSDDKIILNKVLGIYNLLKNPKYLPEIEQEEKTVPSPSLNTFTPPPPPPVPKPVMDMPKSAPISTFTTPAPTSMTATEMTAFEKRLAQVSAQQKPSTNLEGLKQKVEQTKISTMSVDEIKREVQTRELPPSPVSKSLPKPPVSAPVKPASPPPPKPSATFVTSKIAESKLSAVAPMAPPKPIARPSEPAMKVPDNLTDIRKLDDLKRIDINHLRKGPLAQQVVILKNKIVSLAKANKIIPFYALVVFEDSPLFKTYLAHGNAMFAGQKSNSGLSDDEFGAIADLRREVQKM
ncbi:MAG: hypothetical protein KW804_02410 [Candidatus Doudnabacteria bacterium]|nr:hypothetical protein [Candidatus Doudnabacteria bacterium]